MYAIITIIIIGMSIIGLAAQFSLLLTFRQGDNLLRVRQRGLHLLDLVQQLPGLARGLREGG